MTQNSADTCVYMKRENWQLVFVLHYVDGFLVSLSCTKRLMETNQKLSSRFKINELEDSEIIHGIALFWM